MVDFAFNTGWRIGEIRRLKWEDVDQEKGTAWIMDPKNGQTVEIELNDKALRSSRGRRKEAPSSSVKRTGSMEDQSPQAHRERGGQCWREPSEA